MKVRTENIYRASLFVPILFFIREYIYIFTEILNGNQLKSISSGLSDFSLSLSIPLLSYLLTVIVLLLFSRGKTAKEIFRIFVFAPFICSVFVIAWFAIFSYLTVTGKFPIEGTMFPVLVALVVAIAIIPIGYFIMGVVALVYVIAKKVGLIDEQHQMP